MKQNFCSVLFLFAALFSSLIFGMSALARESAGPAFDLASFGRLPVLHEGRVKPLDSFARAIKRELSGSDRGAVDWLAESVFNPAQAEEIRILKITHPDLLNMLGLERRTPPLFSFEEVAGALRARAGVLETTLRLPDDQRTTAQRELSILNDKMSLLSDLLSSASLFLPLATQLTPDVSKSLQPYAKKHLSYLDVLKFRSVLEQETRVLIKKRGEDPARYTPAEQSVVYLAFSMDGLYQQGQRVSLLRVIPVPGAALFVAPWAVAVDGQGGPESAAAFGLWRDLSQAYHREDSHAFAAILTALEKETQARTAQQGQPVGTLSLEFLYNHIHPFGVSLIFYVLAGAGVLFVWVTRREGIFRGQALIGGLILTGWLFHVGGIVARIVILGRPPVSTLYESILFAAAVVVAYGLLIAARSSARAGAWVGTAAAGVILHILARAHEQDGDSFMVLTPVLNTPFWLATHVIFITLGYAFALVASGLAHFILWRGVRSCPLAVFDRAGVEHLHSVALIALFFAVIGTVLGGVWADQSWGRFWGWDPKENGALLLVLWLVWTLHAQVTARMAPVFVIAAYAFLSVIVALSWLGVNWLGVGLHAYGFSATQGGILAGFIGVEIVLIGALTLIYRRRAVRAEAPS